MTREERFVTMSIRCPRCLTWSLDDANFCHICGYNVRPWPEDILFSRIGQLLDESAKIIKKLSENERKLALLEKRRLTGVSKVSE